MILVLGEGLLLRGVWNISPPFSVSLNPTYVTASRMRQIVRISGGSVICP